MHELRMIREQAEALRDGMRRRGKLEVYGPVIEEAEALAWDEVNDRPDTNYASWDVESIEEVTNQGESE